MKVYIKCGSYEKFYVDTRKMRLNSIFIYCFPCKSPKGQIVGASSILIYACKWCYIALVTGYMSDSNLVKQPMKKE